MVHAEPSFADLPPGVRGAVVASAAAVLGDLPADQVPRSLRDVQRFTPAQRARAGAVPLIKAVQRETGFRALTAGRWRREHPALATLLDVDVDVDVDVEEGEAGGEGEEGGVADPIAMITGLYLVRPESWSERIAALRERWELAAEARRQAEERDRTAAAGDVVRARLDDAVHRLEQLAQERDALAEELAALKRERRKLRSDGDRARAATRQAEQALSQVRAEASDLARAHEAQTREARHQAVAAGDELERLRQTERERRSLDEVRTRLLLDTIVDAASGLRRELALPPAERTPADLVASALASESLVREEISAARAMPARGLSADDPALLTELLRLPRVHLIVDGYNVTIGGLPGMALNDQRRLLVDALGALGSRAGAEVTCCFDGSAEPSERSAAALVRGVRVMFSDAGTTADELIRRLARAEPRGRPVVVVSTDREVADGVRAAGARPVPSAALLRLLGLGRR